jgi:hypothetical protein
VDGPGYDVVVSAGSLRPGSGVGIPMPHRWTDDGVVVEAEFTGAHLFHLAAAGCVLNDLFREAGRLGIVLDGALVRARGGFDTVTWTSTGVVYEVELASSAVDDEVAELLRVVDEVAEIPRAFRAGTTVSRQ